MASQNLSQSLSPSPSPEEELRLARSKVKYYETAVRTMEKVLTIMTPIGPMLSQASLDIQHDAVLRLREKMCKDLAYLRQALSISKSLCQSKQATVVKILEAEKIINPKPKTRPKRLKLIIQNKSEWQKDDCLRCGKDDSKLEACYGSAAVRFCSRDSKDCMTYAVDMARRLGEITP